MRKTERQDMPQKTLAHELIARLAPLFQLSERGARGLPLHAPSFSGNESRFVQDCIESTMVSTIGEYVDRFEEHLCEYTGAAGAVAVVNGTCGLHLALTLVGVQPQDEVLVPTLTFAATAAAVVHSFAIPHFVDSASDSLNCDIKRIDEYLQKIATIREDGFLYNGTTNRRISAFVPVHIFGHPLDRAQCVALCEKWNLLLVEDAAEALGSWSEGTHCGLFGAVGVLSFNGNKIITTGGGGALLFQDKELAKQAKHLSTTARAPHQWRYVHDAIGYNYRLPNINAALGCAQMEMLEEKRTKKQQLTAFYRDHLADMQEVSCLLPSKILQSNCWLNAIQLHGNTSLAVRDTLIEELHEKNIFARPLWDPLHTLSIYENYPKASCENAEHHAKQTICLPSSPELTDLLS